LVYPRERLLVLERDNNTCKKCGKKFNPVMLRVDHKVRPQDGGSGQMENLQTLCIACHIQKHIELRERMNVPQDSMGVTLTIQLQPEIYEELKLVGQNTTMLLSLRSFGAFSTFANPTTAERERIRCRLKSGGAKRDYFQSSDPMIKERNL
jgi:hypothetical protein